MNTSFDEKKGDAEKFAETAACRWVTVVERDKAGNARQVALSENVNQEPTYEELIAQRLRGVKPDAVRVAAIARRRELNGGFLPASPDTVRRAVLEACAAVDAHRTSLPAAIDPDELTFPVA